MTLEIGAKVKVIGCVGGNKTHENQVGNKVSIEILSPMESATYVKLENGQVCMAYEVEVVVDTTRSD